MDKELFLIRGKFRLLVVETKNEVLERPGRRSKNSLHLSHTVAHLSRWYPTPPIFVLLFFVRRHQQPTRSTTSSLTSAVPAPPIVYVLERNLKKKNQLQNSWRKLLHKNKQPYPAGNNWSSTRPIKFLMLCRHTLCFLYLYRLCAVPKIES